LGPCVGRRGCLDLRIGRRRGLCLRVRGRGGLYLRVGGWRRLHLGMRRQQRHSGGNDHRPGKAQRFEVGHNSSSLLLVPVSTTARACPGSKDEAPNPVRKEGYWVQTKLSRPLFLEAENIGSRIEDVFPP